MNQMTARATIAAQPETASGHDEMPPTMLEVQVLSDGRKAVRYIRRIDEVVFLPPDEDVPVDDTGNLTKPPSELRGEESHKDNPG